MSTLLITHPVCLKHENPPGHPERVARLERLLAALDGPEYKALLREEAPLASREDLLLAHPEVHPYAMDEIEPEQGWVGIDSDTFMCPATPEAAKRAAGAAVCAVDRVMAGEAGNAFCAVRPPGHHAERVKAMGFCFFGNVVVGARHALERHGLERVSIVDFDVHHGNGTQDLVYDDPRIQFVSTHQMPLYPGTGSRSESGCGNVVNIPLDPGTGGAAYREIFEEQALPAVDGFKPQMVIVSAGFDAHRADPLAQIDLEDEDFVWVTEALLDLAESHANDRLVSSLEGGYDLDALASAGALHVKALMERS